MFYRLVASLLLSILRSKPPLVDEHAFPLTGFAVAWLGCSLHLVMTTAGPELLYPCSSQAKTRGESSQSEK